MGAHTYMTGNQVRSSTSVGARTRPSDVYIIHELKLNENRPSSAKIKMASLVMAVLKGNPHFLLTAASRESMKSQNNIPLD